MLLCSTPSCLRPVLPRKSQHTGTHLEEDRRVIKAPQGGAQARPVQQIVSRAGTQHGHEAEAIHEHGRLRGVDRAQARATALTDGAARNERARQRHPGGVRARARACPHPAHGRSAAGDANQVHNAVDVVLAAGAVFEMLRHDDGGQVQGATDAVGVRRGLCCCAPVHHSATERGNLILAPQPPPSECARSPRPPSARGPARAPRAEWRAGAGACGAASSPGQQPLHMTEKYHPLGDQPRPLGGSLFQRVPIDPLESCLGPRERTGPQ